MLYKDQEADALQTFYYIEIPEKEHTAFYEVMLGPRPDP